MTRPPTRVGVLSRRERASGGEARVAGVESHRGSCQLCPGGRQAEVELPRELLGHLDRSLGLDATAACQPRTREDLQKVHAKRAGDQRQIISAARSGYRRRGPFGLARLEHRGTQEPARPRSDDAWGHLARQGNRLLRSLHCVVHVPRRKRHSGTVDQCRCEPERVIAQARRLDQAVDQFPCRHKPAG